MAENTKIKLAKGSRFGDKSATVIINGKEIKVPVDVETSQPEEVLDVLRNAGIYFEVVDGSDGVSNSSTAPLIDTATREVPAVDPLTANAADSPIPTLKEGDDDGGPGVGPVAAAAIGRDQQEGQLNAEGQGIAAGMRDEDKAMKQDDGGSSDEKPPVDSPTDGNIDDLKEALSSMSDKAELEKLLETEKAGKNRTGAINAIQSKIDAA